MPEVRVLPLTAAQSGLLAEIPTSGPDPYVAQVHVDIAGQVDPDDVRSACRAAVDRVPNLRAAVDATSARRPLLVLGGPGPQEWHVVDLRDGGDPAERCERMLRSGFDVAEGDLLRFALLRLPGGVSRLVVTFHHLVLDGWSAGLLLRLVLQCLVAGEGAPVPPPVARMLRWQVAHPAGVQVWARVLDGARPTTVQGSVVAPAHGQAGRSAVPVTLRHGTREAVARRAESAGTTVATVLQAAWGVTLGRALGRTDVLFAVVDSGRSVPVDGIDEMIGMLVVTTVRRVRTRAGVDEALSGLTRDVAATVGAVPMSLGGVNELLGAVAADTLVVVDNQAELLVPGRLPDGLRLVGSGGVQQSAFPVVLHVTTAPELRIEITYDRAVVGDAAAQVLARLAAAAVEDVARGGVPCLSAGDRTACEQAPRGAEPGRTLLQDVLATAAQDPGRPAVVEPTGSTTYGELADRAARVAGALSRQGVRAGDVVAVCLDRSAELAATVLGIRQVGAAYLALDPSQPAARRQDLVLRTGCAAVVDSPAAVTEIPDVVPVVVPPDEPPMRGSVHGSGLAYVVHTSGSSGMTKGVAVHEAALASQLTWLAGEVRPHAQDRFLWRTSVAFDASVWELWLPLVTGATIVVAGADDGADPAALRRLLGEVTVAQLVPTLLASVVDDPSWRPGPGLRLLAVGGEPFAATLAARVVSPTGPRVVNLYGPTETTVQVAAHEVGVEDLGTDTVVPVGAAVDGTGLHVLSDELLEVADQVVGELWVTGTQLATGYLGDPARTAASFVASPVGPAGERAYRTGDLAWRGARGTVVAGRRDRQVKIRGYRLDLAEVEAVTEAVPGVQRCVASVRTLAAGRSQLVVAVVLDRTGPGAPDEAGLRAAVARRLPAPAVPDLVVVTDDLPTLPSGKPDGPAVAALVEAAVSARLPGPHHDAPQDGHGDGDIVVEVVRRAVADVLDLDLADVGPDDDVVALGLDSVTSLGVVARVRRDGWEIAPREVHQARTARAVAAMARATARTAADDGIGEVPLTPFVAEQLERGAMRSFQVALVRVPAAVDEAALRRLGGALLATHPMLRARLVDAEQGLVLVVDDGPAPAVDARLVDVGPDELSHAVRDQVVVAAGDLDPSGGRMMVLRAVRSGTTVLLAVVVHHLAVDAVSMRTLLDDLRDAWQRGGAPHLLAPTTSYRTWARAVADHVASAHVEDLAGPPRAEDPLPHDGGRATRRATALGAGLAARALTQDAPPERLVLAATVLALHRVALDDGRGTLRTVEVEVEGHGRDLVRTDARGVALDVSRTVGWFTRSRLVRVDLARLRLGTGWSRTEDLVELVERVRRADPPDDGSGHEARRARRGPLGADVLVNYLGSMPVPETDAHWRPLADIDGLDLAEASPELLPVSHPLTLDVLHVRGPRGVAATTTWGCQDGVALAPVEAAWPEALADLCTALEGIDDTQDDWWDEAPFEPAATMEDLS